MKVGVLYVGLEDRKRKVDAQEALGRRMVSDTFADVINAGTMVFTDDPPVEILTETTFQAQLDALAARITALEAK